MKRIRISIVGKFLALVVILMIAGGSVVAGEKQASGKFEGVKANKGTVTFSNVSGKLMLTLSADFVVPDTPDPHWQVVDSKGNVYLLQRLKIKDDKVNHSITLPGYIHDLAKVQIWCAWAEALLGEAAFRKPVM